MENKDFSPFRICCYREQGIRHREENRPCEDACAAYVDAATYVAAVALADGAGSCSNAAEGARLTAGTAAQFLAENFDFLFELDEESMARRILQAVRMPLQQTAEEHDWTLGSLSATLLVAALHPDGRHLVFHVGDGVILGHTCSGITKIVSQYTHTEAINRTEFVTLDDPSCQIDRGRNTLDGFFLMSDGPELWMTHCGKVDAIAQILMQMAYFFPGKRLESELAGLAAQLKRKNEFDDMSFVLFADRQRAGEVFCQIDAPFRETLFGVAPQMKRETERQYKTLFHELARRPQGASASALCRLLHIRSNMILERKLDGLLFTEVLRKENGSYRF